MSIVTLGAMAPKMSTATALLLMMLFAIGFILYGRSQYGTRDDVGESNIVNVTGGRTVDSGTEQAVDENEVTGKGMVTSVIALSN